MVPGKRFISIREQTKASPEQHHRLEKINQYMQLVLMAPILHSGGLTKGGGTPPLLYIPAERRTVPCNAITQAPSIQEPGDDRNEVVEVFKDPSHTATQDPHPETVESDLESSPSKMDKVSLAKKRKAAAEEATSVTEGPPKEEDSIVMAKKEGRTLDAKEETPSAEAKKGVPAVEPSSDPSFPTEEDDVKPHATSIQELGFLCNLKDFLKELLHTASHIPPSTDKKLNHEQSSMMSEEIPSITSDSTQENEEEALTIPERTHSFLLTEPEGSIEESGFESEHSGDGVLLSTVEEESSATKDAPEEANEDAPTVTAVKSTKVGRYLHRGGSRLGSSSAVADDEISELSLKTAVTKKKARQEETVRKVAKACKQGPATISLKGCKAEKRRVKQKVKSTTEDPKEAKEDSPIVKVKEDDTSRPAVKSTKVGRYLHREGRGARSDELPVVQSLKSTTSLASKFFSVIKSVTKKKEMSVIKSVTKKKGMQEETKGKRAEASMQGPATISRKGHKAEKRSFRQRVKSKYRLSEEVQLLKGMCYKLQSRIDETNAKENTASCFCIGYHVRECLEWFVWGDDETVSTNHVWGDDETVSTKVSSHSWLSKHSC